MRLTKTILASLALVATLGSLKGQDLHNTLFYMNPIHINPAFTGAFEGTYRIGGIYRDQYRSVVKNAYSTPTIFIDAPILMLGKRHWLGVGGLLFQDVAGTGKMKISAMQLSGALHLALDKKSQNVFTIAAQYGKVQRSIKDPNAFIYGDYLEQVQSNMTNPMTQDQIFGQGGTTGQDPQKSFTDINAGLLFKSKVDKNTNYNIGVSVRHITTPTYEFKAQTPDLPMRFTVHGQLNTPLTGKWSISPEVYFTSLSPARQWQLHGWAGYMLKPEKNIKLNFGLGYRGSDSGQVLLGMDYGDVKAALSYDVTLSKLNDANNYKGGFELAVYYIGKIYKKPTVPPVILGPHL